MKKISMLFAAMLAVMQLCGAAVAAYPERPVTIVVPYAPGGSTDILARLVAEAMQRKLGQPVVIENRGGAGSALGTQFVAQAAPDGYTVLMASSAHTVNPALRDNVGYDPVAGFAPISRLVTIPHVMVVSTKFPVTSVAELIAYAKKNPGAVNYGSSGPGTSNHLESELFAKRAGIELVHVPYKGIGPAITDLMSGRLQMIVGSLSSLMPSIGSNSVRALAVTSLQRAPTAPDLPTIDEAGIKGFETVDWLGLLVPAKTDKAIVEKLGQTVTGLYEDPAFVARLKELGFVPEGSTPQAFVDVIANDVWSKTARDLGIRTEN